MLIKLKDSIGRELAVQKQELRYAGLGKTEARPIGIAIDYRRTNKPLDGLQANFERLKECKSKLILFPKKLSALKKGESSPEEPKVAAQLRGALMPVKNVIEHEAPRAVTEKKVEIYRLIRRVRADKRFAGKRERKAHLTATADK